LERAAGEKVKVLPYDFVKMCSRTSSEWFLSHRAELQETNRRDILGPAQWLLKALTGSVVVHMG